MKSFTRISSSQHATAEVRPASPTRHTHHDAPSDGSGTTYCSTEPCILCPVLHLQPAAVHQSATGPADDTLPVTGKIWLSSTPLSEQLAPPRRLLPQEPHATITVKTLVPSLSAGSLYPSQLFAVSHLSDRCLWSSSLTGCQFFITSDLCSWRQVPASNAWRVVTCLHASMCLVLLHKIIFI